MSDFNQELDSKEEKSLQFMRKILLGIGGIFVLVDLVRQWPLAEKTYMQFIEGDGYMSLMMGLIIIVLAFAIKLLVGQENDS
jgi:hypothetical protein